jgi:hypothetical protein
VTRTDYGLRQESLRGRLTGLTLITAVLAVGFAAAGLIAYEVLWFRGQLTGSMASAGDILGSNIAAPLVFHNSSDVDQSLSALASDRSIVRGYVFDAGKE